MELKDVMINLDYEKLENETGNIGCPFTFYYTNIRIFISCEESCGQLFPKACAEGCCPCKVIKTPGYVKRKFWKVLEKVRKEKPNG